MIFKIGIVTILTVGSVYDWKYMSVPIWLLGFGVLWGAGSVVNYCLQDGGTLWDIVAGCVPGVAALFLACVTWEQIGYADGVLLLAMGGSLGFGRTLWAVCLALLAAFFVSMGLVVTKRATMKQKLPFVPCLALGSLLVVGGELFFG